MNRVTRKKNDNFTVISNVFLRDKNLSIKAKGFLAVVMGLPEDWEFTINGICQVIKEGKTSIYNVINELKERGYCSVESCRSDKGVILGNDYSFYEEPHLNFQKQESPRTDNQDMGSQPQLNTDKTKDLGKKKTKDKEYNNKDASEENWRESYSYYQSLVVEAKNKLLSDQDYQAYIEQYYPNSDYQASINKMLEGFWNTEEGWTWVRKHRKGKTINMFATLKKNLDKRSSIVYKSSLFNKKSNSVSKKIDNLNPMISVIDKDGTLNDGTIYKDGYRYYMSKLYGRTISIPLMAAPKPAGENFEYDYKLGWYECK